MKRDLCRFQTGFDGQQSAGAKFPNKQTNKLARFLKGSQIFLARTYSLLLLCGTLMRNAMLPNESNLESNSCSKLKGKTIF